MAKQKTLIAEAINNKPKLKWIDYSFSNTSSITSEDLKDLVRKSELFDLEHNTILSELIPETDTVVKWLKGKGRPDKPETTEGVIQGDEADCTRYLSTDGAGTGALEWEKRGGVWHVVRVIRVGER